MREKLDSVLYLDCSRLCRERFGKRQSAALDGKSPFRPLQLDRVSDDLICVRVLAAIAANAAAPGYPQL
jgi:hypothetical protein